MSIADKLVTIAENEQKVYKAGYDSAVKEGTITILETTKELKIEGLPKAPKTLNLLATTIGDLKDYSEDTFLVRGLDYLAEGYYQGNSTSKRLANLWIVNKTGNGASASILEKNTIENNKNLITFENGVFTFGISGSNAYYFGTNFTYKWIATF